MLTLIVGLWFVSFKNPTGVIVGDRGQRLALSIGPN
jgi:hypothetical protein